MDASSTWVSPTLSVPEFVVDGRGAAPESAEASVAVSVTTTPTRKLAPATTSRIQRLMLIEFSPSHSAMSWRQASKCDAGLRAWSDRSSCLSSDNWWFRLRGCSDAVAGWLPIGCAYSFPCQEAERYVSLAGGASPWPWSLSTAPRRLTHPGIGVDGIGQITWGLLAICERPRCAFF